LTGFYKQEYTTKEQLDTALEKKKRKKQFLEELHNQAKKKYEEQTKTRQEKDSPKITIIRHNEE